MKRLLLASVILCAGAFVFLSQHRQRDLIEKQNVQLAAMVGTLKKRSEESASAVALAEEKIRPLQLALIAQQASRGQAPSEPATPPVPAPPDPTRQGGWPQNVDYFYLPKAFLSKASFQVLNKQQLTEEAASLFNLTEPEREDMNRAISDLFAQLRSAESERMQLVDFPEEWSNSRNFSSGVAYHIPSFSNDVAAWREALQQRLESILGSERSALLGSGLDDHLRQDWNDLGESERTVGFVWRLEPNGVQSLWSATRDKRHGYGAFRRYFPGGPDESTFRHYAELFGVELPRP
jgi:hypothetical protein